MDKANAIKRSFIKKNVKAKFIEISDRINNIARTITIFKIDEKADYTEIEKEIADVYIRMDQLTENVKENNEQRALGMVIRQPSRLRRERSVISSKEADSHREKVEATGDKTGSKSARAERLLNDAH